jgi:hypothetical protein
MRVPAMARKLWASIELLHAFPSLSSEQSPITVLFLYHRVSQTLLISSQFVATTLMN